MSMNGRMGNTMTHAEQNYNLRKYSTQDLD